MITIIMLTNGCIKHPIHNVGEKQQSQLKLKYGKGWEVMEERRRKWNRERQSTDYHPLEMEGTALCLTLRGDKNANIQMSNH